MKQLHLSPLKKAISGACGATILTLICARQGLFGNQNAAHKSGLTLTSDTTSAEALITESASRFATERSRYEVAHVVFKSEGQTGAPADALRTSGASAQQGGFSARFVWETDVVIKQGPCPTHALSALSADLGSQKTLVCTVFIPAPNPEQFSAEIGQEPFKDTGALMDASRKIFVLATTSDGLPVRFWGPTSEGTSAPEAYALAVNLQRILARLWGAPFRTPMGSPIEQSSEPSVTLAAAPQTGLMTEGALSLAYSVESTGKGRVRVTRNSSQQKNSGTNSGTNSAEQGLTAPDLKSVTTQSLEHISTTRLAQGAGLQMVFHEDQNALAGPTSLGKSQTDIRADIVPVEAQVLPASMHQAFDQALSALQWNKGTTPWILADFQTIKREALERELRGVTFENITGEMQNRYRGMNKDATSQETLPAYLRMRDALFLHPEWASRMAQWSMGIDPRSRLFADLALALRTVGCGPCQEALVQMASTHSEDPVVWRALILELGFVEAPDAVVVRYFMEARTGGAIVGGQESLDTLDLMSATIARKISATHQKEAQKLSQNEAQEEAALALTEAARRSLSMQQASHQERMRSLAILGNSALAKDSPLLIKTALEVIENQRTELIDTAVGSLRYLNTPEATQALATLVTQSPRLSTQAFDALAETLRQRANAGLTDPLLRDTLQASAERLQSVGPEAARKQTLGEIKALY